MAAFEAPGGHPSNHELDLFVMGKLPPNDRERIRAHILTCGPCADAVLTTYEVIDALRGALKKDFTPPAGE
jgi:anti-sigma factor RsiW